MIVYSLSPENSRNWPVPLFILDLNRDLRTSVLTTTIIDTLVHFLFLMNSTSLSIDRIKRNLRYLQRFATFSLLLAALAGGLEPVFVPPELKILGAVNASLKIVKYSIYVVVFSTSITAFLVINFRILKFKNKISSGTKLSTSKGSNKVQQSESSKNIDPVGVLRASSNISIVTEKSKQSLNNNLFRNSLLIASLAYLWVLYGIFTIYNTIGVCYIYE